MKTAEIMAHIKDRKRRRKVVMVGEDWIRKAIQMPEDVFLEDIYYDVVRKTFVICCSHPNWEPVEDYCEPPSVLGHMNPVWVKAKDLHKKTDEDIILMNLHIDWNDDVHNQ